MKIAVMLPVYNSEETLQRCIDSIKSQTYKDWIVIALDDCSNDNSYNILKQNESEKFFAFRNEINIGCPASRNKILDIIENHFQETDVVAIQDADDWSDDDRFEKQVEFMSNNPEYGICGTFFYWHEAERDETVPFNFDDISDEQIRKSQYFKSHTCHGSYLIRKEVFLDIGRYDTSFRWCHDRDWIFRFLCNGKWKICTIPHFLYHAWITEYTHSKTEERLLNEKKIRYKLYCMEVGCEYSEENWRNQR